MGLPAGRQVRVPWVAPTYAQRKLSTKALYIVEAILPRIRCASVDELAVQRWTIAKHLLKKIGRQYTTYALRAMPSFFVAKKRSKKSLRLGLLTACGQLLAPLQPFGLFHASLAGPHPARRRGAIQFL